MSHKESEIVIRPWKNHISIWYIFLDIYIVDIEFAGFYPIVPHFSANFWYENTKNKPEEPTEGFFRTEMTKSIDPGQSLHARKRSMPFSMSLWRRPSALWLSGKIEPWPSLRIHKVEPLIPTTMTLPSRWVWYEFTVKPRFAPIVPTYYKWRKKSQLPIVYSRFILFNTLNDLHTRATK